MLIVNKIKCTLFDENCYVVYSNISKTGVIIDPGSDIEKILNTIQGLNIKAVLLTHGHFDHIMSCAKLQKLGYKVYVARNDAFMCEDASFALSYGCCLEEFVPDYIIENNQHIISFDDLKINILHVPGHTKGGLAYIIGNNIFSGDTLFYNGHGRTDLPGGNFKEILMSIELLKTYIKKGYTLFCGHDY